MDNDEASGTLRLHIGIDIHINGQRFALGHGIDRITRFDDVRFRQYGNAVQCAETGVALLYAPEQHVSVRWQVGDERFHILVRAGPETASRSRDHNNYTEYPFFHLAPPLVIF